MVVKRIQQIIFIGAAMFIMASPVAAHFTGAIRQHYTFRTKATDPGDQVFYSFNWNDSTASTSPESGFVAGNVAVDARHSWGWAGAYDVVSVAYDDDGAVSGNSNIVTANIQPPSDPGQPCQTAQLNNWNSACVATSEAGITNGTFTLAWTASDPRLNTHINQYIVQRTGTIASGATTTTIMVGANHGQGTLVYGFNNTPSESGCYQFRVQAEDSVSPTANLSGISGLSEDVIYDVLAPERMNQPVAVGALNGFVSGLPSWEFVGVDDNGDDQCWDSTVDHFIFKIVRGVDDPDALEHQIAVVPFAGAGTVHTVTQTAGTSGTTYYAYVKAVDAAGNESLWSPAGQATMTPSAPPTADWDYCSPDLTYIVQFADRSTPSTGKTINYWSWDFGDGEVSSSQNPSHSYIPDLTPPPDPTCSPGDTTYNASISVNCMDAEAGASIRYTTDGSIPTLASTPWTSTLNFISTTILKVRAWDAAENPSNTVTYTYTLNLPPVAVNDTATTFTNNAVAINVPANDSDSNGTLDLTKVVIVSPPSNGNTSINSGTGVITYTPNVGWTGDDSFTYTIRDNNDAISNAATVAVTVSAGVPTTIAVRVSSNNDDAEQSGSSVSTGSSTLNIDSSQYIGMRFQGITIPQGAAITNAFITFTASGSDNNSENITIWGDDVDDAVAYSSSSNNISSRADTSASVTWSNVPSWSSGNTYDTTSFANVVQEIVDRPGWVSGNDLAITMRGNSSERRARSRDSGSSQAPLLTITYLRVNQSPTAVNDSGSASMNGSVSINVASNDTDSDGTIVAGSVSIVTPPSHGSAVPNGNGTVTYTPETAYEGNDSFTYTIEDNEGAVSNAATVSVTVEAIPLDWWNSSWKRRRQITFNNSAQAENLDNFPVLIKLNQPNTVNPLDPANRIDYSQTKSNGDDIRFVDANAAPGATPLAYEIESWNNTGDSYIWVKVPRIDASSNTDSIWMYYGNTGASDCQTDPDCPDAVNVWSNSYRGVWHLKENQSGTGTSGVYKDSTSSNCHGADYVSASGQTGKIGSGQQFDGNNDYVGFGTCASLSGTTDFTAEAWIRSSSDDYAIIQQRNGGFNGQYDMRVNSSGNIYFYVYGNSAYQCQLTSSSSYDVDDNQWWNVVGVRSGGTLRVYLNGVQRGTCSGTARSLSSSITTQIGYDIRDGGLPMDGYMDEVRVSTIARSAAWVSAQYKSMNDTLISSFGTEGLIARTDDMRVASGRRLLPEGMYTMATRIQTDAAHILASWERLAGTMAAQARGSIVQLGHSINRLRNEGFRHELMAQVFGPFNVTLQVQDTGGGTDTSTPIEIDFNRSCAFNLVTVSAPNCHSIELIEWSHANAANQYVVYWEWDHDGNAATPKQVSSATVNRSSANCNASGCTYAINNLLPDTMYDVYIRAQPTAFYNNYGACVGTQSNKCPAVIGTPVCGVNSVDVDVSQCGSITLSWNPVDGASGGYDVFRELRVSDLPQDPLNTVKVPINGGNVPDEPGSGLVTDPGTGKITFTDRNIITRQTYQYRVFPYDSEDEAGGSATVEARNFCFEGPTYEEK